MREDKNIEAKMDIKSGLNRSFLFTLKRAVLF